MADRRTRDLFPLDTNDLAPFVPIVSQESFDAGVTAGQYEPEQVIFNGIGYAPKNPPAASRMQLVTAGIEDPVDFSPNPVSPVRVAGLFVSTVLSALALRKVFKR